MAQPLSALCVLVESAQGWAARYARSGGQCSARRARGDKEVSGMIQQALVSKNYRMANQLLIDFERKKLHDEPVSSKPPAH